MIAAGFARDYFLRYRARQEEAVRLESQTALLQAQLAEARLDALRMQINPHFLFNTLHAISTLVERDPRGVRRMIARLSELLRHTTQRQQRAGGATGAGARLPAALPGNHADPFSGASRNPDAGRARCVERTGPQPHPAAAGRERRQAWCQPRDWGWTDRNSGCGERETGWWWGCATTVRAWSAQTDPGEWEGVGLRNVRARLEQLYGEAQGFVLRAERGGGVLAQIELPYHTAADLHTTDLSTPPTVSAHAV